LSGAQGLVGRPGHVWACSSCPASPPLGGGGAGSKWWAVFSRAGAVRRRSSLAGLGIVSALYVGGRLREEVSVLVIAHSDSKHKRRPYGARLSTVHKASRPHASIRMPIAPIPLVPPASTCHERTVCRYSSACVKARLATRPASFSGVRLVEGAVRVRERHFSVCEQGSRGIGEPERSEVFNECGADRCVTSVSVEVGGGRCDQMVFSRGCFW
jgi:hypothetical protein